jgi:hypothetical protein
VRRARILLLLDMGHHHGLSTPELELLGESFSSSNHPTGQQQLQQSWGREEGGSSTQMMMMHEVIQQRMLSLQSLTTRACRWQKHWKPMLYINSLRPWRSSGFRPTGPGANRRAEFPVPSLIGGNPTGPGANRRAEFPVPSLIGGN